MNPYRKYVGGCFTESWLTLLVKNQISEGWHYRFWSRVLFRPALLPTWYLDFCIMVQFGFITLCGYSSLTKTHGGIGIFAVVFRWDRTWQSLIKTQALCLHYPHLDLSQGTTVQKCDVALCYMTSQLLLFITNWLPLFIIIIQIN